MYRLLIILLLSYGHAIAQSGPKEVIKLDSQFLVLPYGKFGGSSVDVYRQYLGASTGFPLADNLILTTGLSQETSQYNWRDEGSLSASFEDSEPIDNAYLHRLSFGGVYKDGTTTTIVKNFLNSSGDYRGGNPLTYGLLGIHNYSVNKNLSVAFVFILNTQLEGNPSAIPAVGFKWNVNDRSALELTGEILGPVLRYTKTINDSVSLFVQGKRESREYRVNSDSIRGGVYYDTSNPILAGVMWKENTTSVSLGAGVDVARQLRVEDQNGDKIVSKSGDTTPIINLQVRTGF